MMLHPVGQASRQAGSGQMQFPVRTTSQQNQLYSWPPYAAASTQQPVEDMLHVQSSIAVPSQHWACQSQWPPQQHICQQTAYHRSQRQDIVHQSAAMQNTAATTRLEPRGMQQLPYGHFAAGPLGPAAAAAPSMLSSNTAATFPVGSFDTPMPPPHSRAIVTTEVSAPQAEVAPSLAISVQAPSADRAVPVHSMAECHMPTASLPQGQTVAQQVSRSETKAAPPARSLRRSRSAAAAGFPVDNAEGLNGVAPAITKAGIASRRFRARQKHLLTSLEADLADKLQQLNLLTAEHEMLQLKESVLSSVVSAGEEQVKLMQEAGPPVFGPNDLLLERARSSNNAATAAQVDRLSSDSSNSDDDSDVLLPMAGRCSSTMATAQAPAVQQQVAAAGAVGGLQEGRQMQAQQQQQQLSVAQGVKCMSSDDILAVWRQFIKDVSYALASLQLEQATAAAGGSLTGTAAAAGLGLSQAADLAAQGGPSTAALDTVNKSAYEIGNLDHGSPAAQRVWALVQKCSNLVRLASQLNPGAYCGIFGRHIDSGVSVSCPDSHWRYVVQQLHLTSDQVKQILACAELYQGQLSDVQQERTQLKQKLQESDVATDKLANDTGLRPGSHWLAGLSSNLKREHLLRVMLNCFVWEKILTPLQGVKACIHSHPFYPDWAAMVDVLRQTFQLASLAFPLTFTAPATTINSSSCDDTGLQQKEDRWLEAANAFLGRQASAVFWGTPECDSSDGAYHWLQHNRADTMRLPHQVFA